LNMSYVLACSADFQATVRSVVDGLNGAGFSADDYRVAEAEEEEPVRPQAVQDPPAEYLLPVAAEEEDDDLSDVPEEQIDFAWQNDVEGEKGPDSTIGEIIDTAVAKGDEYEQSIAGTGEGDLQTPGFTNVKTERMQPEFAEEASRLEIPQFMVQDEAGMFGGENDQVLLTETELLDGFTLAAKDASVPFNPALADAFRVDVSESGDVQPRCRKLSRSELEYFSKHLAGMDSEKRLKTLVDTAATQLDKKIDFCGKREIAGYVDRVVQQLPAAVRQQLSLELMPAFVQCVRDKIDHLVKQHKRAAFNEKLNQNAVLCIPHYKLPEAIQPVSAITYIEKSLYTGEWDDMNSDELTVIQSIAAKENVKWWHRIKDRRGFCINGFVNHYPDFMVLTDRGNVVMVEVKGAHLDGSDSQAKAELGRVWADNAGQKYKYFMVFLRDGDAVQGALQVDAFLNTIEKL
ncbi:MAG: hypothetical protein J6Y19_06445, partial [Kiritimatiellae bacterium]|nr:hypothetical protein [Kiritimatiellia bacterium]